MVATQLATLMPPMSTSPLPQIEDLDLVQMTRANVLILGGDRPATLRVLDEIRPHLEPVMYWRAGERLRLPMASRRGTLVLDGLDAMTIDDQCRLLEWLDDTTRATRVVSTAKPSLLDRIDAGMFFEQLYYRLNTICLDIH